MKSKIKENDQTVIDELKNIYTDPNLLVSAGVSDADCMIWFINRQYRLIYFNPLFEQYIHQFDLTVKFGDSFENYAHLFGNVFQKHWKSYCTHTLEGNYFTTNETVLYPPNFTKNENTIHPDYLKINLSYLKWQNRIRGVCFMAFDISDQIAMVKSKTHKQQFYKSIVEKSTDIILMVDAEGYILYNNETIKHYIESDVDNLVGLHLLESIVSDADREAFLEAFENVKRFPENSMQVRLSSISPIVGEITLIMSLSNLLEVKELQSILCSIRVLDKHLEKEEVEPSLFPYQQLIDFSSELYLMIDKQGHFCYGSPSIKSYLGYEPEHYIGKSLFTMLHPDCWDYAHTKLEEAIHKPRKPFTIHLQLIDRYGMKKWIQGTACNLLDVPGIEAITGHFRDSGEQLFIDTTKETQYKTIFQYFSQTTIPILICEPEYLRIIQINESALKFLGYELYDIKNKTVLELLPSEYHANIQSLITSEANANSMNGKIIAHRLITRSNKIIVGEVWANIIKADSCDLVSLTIREKIVEPKGPDIMIYSKVNSDIGVLKATIEAQEHERIEIGRELHDNVLQLIGTIQLYLDCLKTTEVHLYNQDEILNKAEDVSKQIMKEIRKVSHNLIKTYSVDVGLKLSIEDLLDSLSMINNFNTQLDYINVIDSDLSHDLKFNIYRIIQEQINNIIKHAKANNIIVRLTQAASILTLQIIDDGVGFDKDLDLSTGVGLKNIRNRVQLYNGELIFKAVPKGSGCILMATFKLHQKEA